MIYVVNSEDIITKEDLYLVNTIVRNENSARMYLTHNPKVRGCKFFTSSHNYVDCYVDLVAVIDVGFKKPLALSKDILARKVPLLQVIKYPEKLLIAEFYFGDKIILKETKVKALCI